jgi:protein-tyrosine phosphatase
MLQFFSKKQFLKDLLEDFVDIHTHILPGIDDGAKNLQESIDLLNQLQALGIKKYIATPHIMQDFYPNTEETIGNAYELLLGNVGMNVFDKISIKPAAEYMLDAHFEHLLTQENLITLKDNYVLIELSYLQPPLNLEALIFNIKLKGYIPVLAHPERYQYFHNKLEYYKRLKYLGCLFQLNLLALTAYYGKRVHKTATFLLEENLIDFAGTDTHNTYQIETLSNAVLSKKTAHTMVGVIQHTNNTFKFD